MWPLAFDVWMKMGDPNRVEIRLTLKGEMARRFNDLKPKWGFESNTGLLRMIITKAYEKLKYLSRSRQLS
nr:hypothetical protein [Candidatus Njordarchaeum guaymaensis]